MFTMTVNEGCKVSTLQRSVSPFCVFDLDIVNQSEHSLYFVIIIILVAKV